MVEGRVRWHDRSGSLFQPLVGETHRGIFGGDSTSLFATYITMKEYKLGIIMNGVTGRMGTNQHLIRSICAIRDQGGVDLS